MLNMQHKSWMLILALVCAPVASKADLCFNYEGGGGTHVGKDFTLTDDIARNVNRCAPFNGFEDGGLGGAITGTGCIAETAVPSSCTTHITVPFLCGLPLIAISKVGSVVFNFTPGHFLRQGAVVEQW